MSWLSKVFELNPAGLNWPRAVLFLDVALVPLVVFWAIGHEEYLLSALVGVLFAWLADSGDGYGYRASRIAVFALVGAGVTALGFGIGGAAWGWPVLAAFAVTLGLEVVGLVLLMHGAAIRFWNYALYCGAIAAGVLILVDLPQPSNYSAEGYRVLWTVCGVGIGVLVMLLADLLTKHTATASAQPA